MKLRIKFSKTGTMKFISHLDLMRYVQKALRRAEIDVAYSKGYSPHQLLSFAAPLGLGDTSEGDYLDLQVHSMGDPEEFLEKVNREMNEEIRLLSLSIQEENAKPSMALVAAADYCVNLREGHAFDAGRFPEFLGQKEIVIRKKSKRTEQDVDIRPMIYGWGMDLDSFRERQEADGEPVCPVQTVYEDGLTPIAYLRLSCGSSSNLKPDLVMEAFLKWLGAEYEPLAFQIHRLETYADRSGGEGRRELAPLLGFVKGTGS